VGIFAWIQKDFASNKIRFIAEILAWAIGICCAIAMAATMPNPPFIWIYPPWILASGIYAWASWSRKSFGMLSNYLLLITIDLVGLTRIILIG